MSWGQFFTSRPCKYAAISGTFGLVAGGSSSIICALYFSEACSNAVAELQNHISTTITISELDAEVPIRNYTATITLRNLEFKVPQAFFDMLNDAGDEASNYCFQIPLLLGMCITLIAAFALATSAFAIGIYQQQKEDEERFSQYSLLTPA